MNSRTRHRGNRNNKSVSCENNAHYYVYRRSAVVDRARRFDDADIAECRRKSRSAAGKFPLLLFSWTRKKMKNITFFYFSSANEQRPMWINYCNITLQPISLLHAWLETTNTRPCVVYANVLIRSTQIRVVFTAIMNRDYMIAYNTRHIISIGTVLSQSRDNRERQIPYRGRVTTHRWSSTAFTRSVVYACTFSSEMLR